MSLDFDRITIADLMVMEDHGVTLDALTDLADAPDGATPPAKVLAAVAYLAARAEDPAATWEDAINRPFSEITTVMEGGTPDPEG